MGRRSQVKGGKYLDDINTVQLKFYKMYPELLKQTYYFPYFPNSVLNEQANLKEKLKQLIHINFKKNQLLPFFTGKAKLASEESELKKDLDQRYVLFLKKLEDNVAEAIKLYYESKTQPRSVSRKKSPKYRNLAPHMDRKFSKALSKAMKPRKTSRQNLSRSFSRSYLQVKPLETIHE